MKLLSYNLLRDSVITASSSNDLFPVANLYSKRKAQEFRFTGKTSENIVVNKSGLEFDSVIIDNHNLTDTARVVFQANTSDSWDSPAVEFESRKLPVAEYHFDGDLTDERGSYDGVGTDITYETGVVGQAAVFNGTTSTVNLGTLPLVKSISVRVKFDSFPFSGNFILDKYSGATLYGYSIFTNNSGFLNLRFGTISIDAATTLTAGTWYHIVMTYDGVDLSLYVNDVFITKSSTGTGDVDTTTTTQLGGRGGAAGFDGDMDDLRFYDYALSQAEINALYDAPQQDLPPVMEITPTIYYGWEALQDYDYFRVLIEDTDNTEPVKIGMLFLAAGDDFDIRPGWGVNKVFSDRATYRTMDGSFPYLVTVDKSALEDVISNIAGTISLSATRQQFGTAWPFYVVLEDETSAFPPLYAVCPDGFNLMRKRTATDSWEGPFNFQEVF